MQINTRINLYFLTAILTISTFLPESFPQSILFNRFLVKEGLSNDDVNCVLEDKLGFMWFGTEDGLNRFDGYSFRVYRNNPDDNNSISSNIIWALFEDAEGYIWVGTKSGELNRYDPYYDVFTSWEIDVENISENSITAIYKDSKDEVWIGTYRNGFYNFNIRTGKIKNWNHNPLNPKSISNNFITSIHKDKSGSIWLSTYNGLNKFNQSSDESYFTRIYSDPNKNGLSNNLVWSLSSSIFNPDILLICTANGLTEYNINSGKFKHYNFLDRPDLQFSNSISSVVEESVNGETIIWVGSYAGVIRMDVKQGRFERYLVDALKSNGLVSNQINRIYKDRSGVIWLAAEDGLNYYSPKSAKFNHLLTLIKSYDLSSLSSKNIKAISQSNDGNIWFGELNGLHYLNNFGVFKSTEKIPGSNGLSIWSLEAGSNNDIWIGTYGQGLKQLNIKSGQIKSWKIESPTFKTSAFDFIKSLLLDNQNNLWMGFWGGGTARLNLKTNEYKIWRNNPKVSQSLSYNDVWAIHEDKFNRIWIGTNGGGINLFDENDGGIFHRLVEANEKGNKLSSISINCISESNSFSNDETILWVGTASGLIKLKLNDKTNVNNSLECVKEIQIYTIRDGLLNNTIKSILVDENNDLWLGTNSGLTFFNVKSNVFTNYNESDGLTGSEISLNCAIETKENLMFFGSSEGVNVFDPAQIKNSSYKPNLVITGFQIFNQNIAPGKNAPLTKNIMFANEIVLNHSQNVFSFQFSALDYNSPNTINYAYKMEGFDKDWIYSGSRRFVTYTNLNSGEYNFKVKATNSDGVWIENEAAIAIVINPPWWRTIWAYFSYLIIVLIGLYLIRKIEMNRNHLRNELRIRELETEKLRDIEKIKSRFFANLSHEFRTPLMLIKGPVEQLLNGHNVNQSEQVKLIQRNSEKLQTLIDQLLELSQLEAAAIQLRAKKENLVSIVRGNLFSFSELAERKNITLKFHTVKDEIIAWIDRDKFEKMLNNILSNAFKFTAENGTINVEIINTSINNIDYTTVSIKDSGIGIDEEKIDKIFDRFYQVDDSSKRAYSGSGIGLSLVKELVDLHEWKIFVHSKLGLGTEFIIQIPLDENYLNDYQKVLETQAPNDIKAKDSSNVNNIEVLIPDDEGIQNAENKNDAILGYQNKSTILIVEDSEDVRIYLNDILKEDYNIILSENGESGLIESIEKLPDLIISDVMMPKMDGIEFCKKIKSNWQTSHIPVILLTAKASTENKIEGLETGADDYVTKPFNYRELSTRIKNLLAQRRHLKEKFGRDVNFKPENITPNKADQEFLQKAITIVEKNISNPDFDSDIFAKEIFLSRSQLHRKIQSISGQSTGEFIRTFRLKKAAGLILEKQFSITQIAFEVGFNSPSHFSKAFKQLFECLPSEFIDRSKS
ncbi:MAG: two-component regulator propeller domain-containing protein [Ignavibacteriaceae bacterium]